MSSSASSGISDGAKRIVGRGLPRECRCDARAIIRTSETAKNPGRLFYCCPYSSKEDTRHLFKWTDIGMVEEMDVVDSVVEKIKVDVGSLEKGLHVVEAEMETRTCEAVSNRFRNEIEIVLAIAQGCEKEMGELKAMVECCEKEMQVLRSFKNLIICGVGMYLAYLFMFP